ncbi:MAG: sugar phosphate isomerase/epimerase family protein [Rhodopila sp.]|jgi:sugar phosphate isomerase/epimerase
MSKPRKHDIYFSFFMFTANLQPDDAGYTETIARHMSALLKMGYDGFDLPIAPTPTTDHQSEVASYQRLRQRLDKAGLTGLKIATNVGTTRTFDPTSLYKEQRDAALAYLKSRVDITVALGGTMLAGPIIFPYGVFPTTDFNEPVWSDALQNWLAPRYLLAAPVLAALTDYAGERGVTLAIEPVDHWETPAPNMVADVLRFLESIPNPRLGVCIDSAHVVLGSDGPAEFRSGVRQALDGKRLHYVHISAPDRGSIHDSWIPWQQFLEPIMPSFEGPFLLEVFNAVPVFLNSLRQTRRKFWIPGEDATADGPSAYDIAAQALATVCREFAVLTPESAR